MATAARTPSPLFSITAKRSLSRSFAVIVGHHDDAGYPVEVAVEVTTTRLRATTIHAATVRM